ncbi:MAG: rRNA maturation RNase YbeY [Pseudanabaenaceae cyanobacterium]
MLEVCLQIGEGVGGDQLADLSAEVWQKIVQAWQEFLIREYGIPVLTTDCELTIRLTDDREIQQLNQQFRQINAPTDVLAFASLETDAPLIPELNTYLGDIIISVETAQRQAAQQQWQFSKELLWLASHGFLHLLGWDHPDQASLEIMWQIQEKLLNLANICVAEHPGTFADVPISLDE